jgi:sialidase-1
MRNGRWVVPGYVNEYTAERTRLASYSCVVFSDDGGSSWHVGDPVDFPMSNEAQVVELSDGSLLLNWRIQKQGAEHPGCRGTAISHDGGQTWEPPVLKRELNEDPCQAGFIRWPGNDSAGRLLFSNPDTGPTRGEGARIRMTVRLSEDDGRTWPFARLIHSGPSVYSCPAVLPDETVALLYESGDTARCERIDLARFSLDWLKAGRRE